MLNKQKKFAKYDGKVNESSSPANITKVPPLTLEFHVRDLVRLVSGRLPAVADDEVDMGELLVVVAAGSVPRFVVHGHADNFGLEPPAAPRRSASLLQLPRLPGLATTQGCGITKVKGIYIIYPGAFPLTLTMFFCLCRRECVLQISLCNICNIIHSLNTKTYPTSSQPGTFRTDYTFSITFSSLRKSWQSKWINEICYIDDISGLLSLNFEKSYFVKMYFIYIF